MLKRISLVFALIAAASLFFVQGCGSGGTPSGAVVGRANLYDYSPSIIQTGSVRKFWWCGQAQNPNDPAQTSDSILYESIDTTTKQKVGPMVVLAETPGTWDSVFTCNPRVIQGTFQNPLGDGQTYTYALYYVATSSPVGLDNSIGVAFSNDGIVWNKYPQPVITPRIIDTYGVGQPAIYNTDQKSSLVLIYEDSTAAATHVKTTSTDGIHFTVEGVVTLQGMDPDYPQPSWGDAGFDPSTGYWYAAFNLPTRSPSTLGGNGQNGEFGQYGFQLYRIPDASLLSGATPWELLKVVDTNLTGYEANFLPGLLHDMYGSLNVGPWPQVQVYPSVSLPQPPWNVSPSGASLYGYVLQWDIGSFLWTPGEKPKALNRYANLATYEVTTGWVQPDAGFQLKSTLGHLYSTPQNGANTPFFGCKNGSIDYFVSLDVNCEGGRILGLEGYGYAQPVAGLTLEPLYRCFANNTAHFVSHDPKCEGRSTATFLGYALP